MLASVLVPDPDPTRRVQLADEAMAIAAVGNESELVASALLARRLAWWQLDRLDERTAAVLDAVRHAHDAGNVHLELTAMLFAMSDLLEQGRMAEHLAMLDEFIGACRRAARRAVPGVRDVPAGVACPVGR